MKRVSKYLIHLLMSCLLVTISSFVLYKMLEKTNYENFVEDSKSLDRYLDQYFLKAKDIAVIKTIAITYPHLKEMVQGKALPDSYNAKNVLGEINRELDTSIVYVLNRDGVVVASSMIELVNGNIDITGKNYGFRPYFNNAMKGKDGVYAAIGVTTSKRGLYYYAPLREGDKSSEIIGVIVIKAGLKNLDNYLLGAKNDKAVITSLGIVFSTSRKEWLFKSFFSISKDQREFLKTTKQFSALDPDKIQRVKVKIEDNGKFLIDNSKRYAFIKNRLTIDDEFGQWSLLTIKDISSWYPWWLFTSQAIFCFLIYFLIVIVARKIRQRNIVMAELVESERKFKNLSKTLLEKNDELTRHQNELIEMERYKTVNAMIVTYNHELNNPLTIMKGNISQLKKEYKIDENSEYFRNISNAVKRVSGILESIDDLVSSKEISYDDYSKDVKMIRLNKTD